MTNPVLEAIRTRRMARALTDAPVERAQLDEILKAARRAPSAGNRRLHRFVAVQDPVTLRMLRAVSPGMFQRPVAIVVICIDGAKAESFGMRPTAKGLYVDVGTTAQTMLLADAREARPHRYPRGCHPSLSRNSPISVRTLAALSTCRMF